MKKHFKQLPLRVAVLFVFIGAGAPLSHGQDSGAQPQGKLNNQFRTAANRWMLTPVDVQNQPDSASVSERQARDRFWDRLYGATFPLRDPFSQPKLLPMVDYFATPDEFSDQELIERTWLVGTFEGYSTFLSTSELSVYTEITFRVLRVLGNPNIPGLKNGSTISIGCPGGTIIAPWGKIVSFRMKPSDHFFEPNHSYLLGLTYIANGNFFTFNEKISRRWDITNGTAKPDSQEEIRRNTRGQSSIAGKTTEDAVEAITEKIEKAAHKERRK